MSRHKPKETFGIHTNLRIIVDSAGGIDLEYAATILMEDYNIEMTSESYYICILMCRDLNIRDKIDKFGLETVMERTKLEEYCRRIDFAKDMGVLKRRVGRTI